MSESVKASVQAQPKTVQGSSAKGSLLQRAAVHTAPVNDVPPVVHEVLRSPGQPLDPDAKDFMESRFGHDFSGVRVHTDASAAESARAVNARAYTVGKDVAFGAGQYAPGTTIGKQLLAHELTHTIQQSQGSNGGQAAQGKLQVNAPGDIYEQEADTTARQVTTNPGQQVSPAQVTALSSPSVSLVQREPAPAAAGKPLTFNITSNDQQGLVDTMSIVQNIRDTGNGQYSTEFRGQTLTLTQAQLDDLRGKARQTIKENLGKATRKADNARDRYNTQTDIDKESWFSSHAVKAVAYVKSLGDFSDPGPELLGEVAKADADAETARKALDGNNFVEAAHLLAESEASALKAQMMWQAYFEGIIGAGASTITILEYTRDASFITLGILATIATAGAAAGATTTAFGLEVGTASAANLIATGAPIVANLAEAGVKVALGEKVDWGQVAVGIVTDLILSKFGGKLGDGILKAVLNNPETKSIGRVVLERLVHSAISHVSGTAFTTSVNAVYNRLKGQNVTWEQFVDELSTQLSDPKGWFIAGLMAAVSAHAEVKHGSASSASSKPSKESTPKAATSKSGTTEPVSKVSAPKVTEPEPPKVPKASIPKPEEGIAKPTASKIGQKSPAEIHSGESDEIESSFEKTFDQTPVQGPLEKPPTPPTSMPNSKVKAAKNVLGKELGKEPVLDKLWKSVAKPTPLTKENSRNEFNKHRNRFWRAVRNDPAARQIFEDAGFKFPKRPTSAPVHEDISGKQGRISLDHIERRADNPGHAVDPNNLRMVVQGDNTLLENIQQANPTVKKW